MTQTCNSTAMSYLNVPSGKGGMARSTSRESFATDVSLLSLSSLTSDISGSTRCQIHPEELTTTVDRATADLAKDMLEQMLSCSSSLSLPQEKSRRNSRSSPVNRKVNKTHAESESEHESKIHITKSEQDLLTTCAGEKVSRGSMYKSFSTGDLDNYNDTDDLCVLGLANKAQYASQAWLPPGDYVRVLQCRKKHLKDLRLNNCPADDQLFIGFNNDDDITTEAAAAAPAATACGNAAAMSMPTMANDAQQRRRLFCRKAASEDNVGGKLPTLLGGKRFMTGGSFMKKLKFSKELGRRIRDDLFRKLAGKQQKQHLVTKLDLEREKGRPLTQTERNFVILHWLQSLDDGRGGEETPVDK